jgi:hypothetical protein
MATRNYHMRDEVMLQQSHVKRQHFIDDKADFVTFDPDFDDPFETDWNSAINAGELQATDEERDDVLQQETEEVLEVVKLVHQAVFEAKYFIEKAFAAKPKVVNEFGFDNYRTVYNSQAGLAQFLGRLHQLCSVKYVAELTAVNYTAPKIANLLTLKNNLTTENTQQDTFAEDSAIATKARIEQYNLTFGFWSKANKAAKVIYYNNPEKLNRYLFPASDEDAEVISIQGTVRDAVTNNLLLGVSVKINALGITVLTDSNGQYVMAAIPAGEHTLTFIKAGYNGLDIPVVVPPTGSIVTDANLTPA